MAAKEPFVIASPIDAASFRNRALRSPLFPRSGVDVTLGSLSRDERTYWSGRLNTWSRACGCGSGAVFTLVAIAACAAGMLPRPPGLQAGLLACVGWVFGAALAGKVLGLLAARLMLVRDAGKLLIRASTAVARVQK